MHELLIAAAMGASAALAGAAPAWTHCTANPLGVSKNTRHTKGTRQLTQNREFLGGLSL